MRMLGELRSHLRKVKSERRGFTLIELMIVLAIVGIILAIVVGLIIFFVIGKKALPAAKSQMVTDINAIEWVEDELDYTNVRLIESYRTNPQGDLGCEQVDDAGFKLIGTDTDNIEHTIEICCLGSPGSKPRCNLVNRSAEGT